MVFQYTVALYSVLFLFVAAQFKFALSSDNKKRTEGVRFFYACGRAWLPGVR
jgi:hypothetical protein